MRVERLRKEISDGICRVAADITWENRDAPPESLVIETTLRFAPDLEASADAFLLALLPAAQWEGEERILIEGRVCSRLREGLRAAMELFQATYERCRPVSIEPTEGFAPTVARSEPRAASFLSGGVDALSLLRSNRLDYPADHPGFIRDCIVLFGLNTYDLDASGAPRPERVAAFEANTLRMTWLADSVGATVIPMRTNIRRFISDFATWTAVGFGTGTVSTALCLPKRITRIEIASAGLGVSYGLEGSHPTLDHNFSTEAVAVHHGQPGLNRFEKTRIVAEWPEALFVVRPCWYRTIPRDGTINCGKCEKCIRTMLALVALGKLGESPAFPFDELMPATLEPLRIEQEQDVVYYEQCFDALVAAGRSDLVAAVRQKIGEFHKRERRKAAVKLIRTAIPVGAWRTSSR